MYILACKYRFCIQLMVILEINLLTIYRDTICYRISVIIMFSNQICQSLEILLLFEFCIKYAVMIVRNCNDCLAVLIALSVEV